MTQTHTDELFRQYKETGDQSIRNQIVEKYLYIAEILAKKFVGRGVDYDDLKQVASLALLRGVDRFDPSLGMQFTTFITPTITGEIKNYFRDKSRIVKVPRRLSELSSAIRKYSQEYQAKHGEKPTVNEIAVTLNVSQEDVVKALEIGGTVSLDGMATDEEGNEKSLYTLLADDDNAYEAFEIKETVKAAMRDFTDVERALIKCRYLDGLSQNETAKRLGVSQMFVSRMERKLLLRLKERLQDSF